MKKIIIINLQNACKWWNEQNCINFLLKTGGKSNANETVRWVSTLQAINKYEPSRKGLIGGVILFDFISSSSVIREFNPESCPGQSSLGGFPAWYNHKHLRKKNQNLLAAHSRYTTCFLVLGVSLWIFVVIYSQLFPDS